jgi:hypothetical protein
MNPWTMDPDSCPTVTMPRRVTPHFAAVRSRDWPGLSPASVIGPIRIASAAHGMTHRFAHPPHLAVPSFT